MPSHVMIAKKERTFVFVNSKKSDDTTIKILRFSEISRIKPNTQWQGKIRDVLVHPRLIYECENTFSSLNAE